MATCVRRVHRLGFGGFGKRQHRPPKNVDPMMATVDVRVTTGVAKEAMVAAVATMMESRVVVVGSSRDCRKIHHIIKHQIVAAARFSRDAVAEFYCSRNTLQLYNINF
jgi:hypothetical protein